MAYRIPITVRLDAFEGPLDLLLYLIQSHELDITKISIGRITDQYLAYVRLMQELNFDIASEFLVMAATLLQWKSKSLLPQEEKPQDAQEIDEELSRDALILQLLEHQRFLAAGQDLAQLPKLGEDVFARPNKRPPIERVWKEMDITGLALTYQQMLVRARKRKTVLRKETVSLSDKIVEFSHKLHVGKMIEMRVLLGDLATRPDTVATFLASLELSRLKNMRLHQEQTYGTILMELLTSLADFDVHLASGFDAPGAAIAQAAHELSVNPDAAPIPGPHHMMPHEQPEWARDPVATPSTPAAEAELVPPGAEKTPEEARV